MERFCEHDFFFPMNRELNMFYCGWWRSTPVRDYGPWTHAHFLLTFVEEGTGQLLSTNRKLLLNRGDLLVTFPGQQVHYRIDRECDWSIRWLGVSGSLVEGFLADLGITEENCVYNVENHEEAAGILRELYEASDSSAFADGNRCVFLAYSFFTALFRCSPLDRNPDPVREAIHIIRCSFDKQITVASLAEALHLTPAYLARIFRGKTGMSPGEYILAERMRKAAYLLIATDAPVKEIAASVGISDSMYFSRLFRRKFGLSPTAFRESAPVLPDENQRTRFSE